MHGRLQYLARFIFGPVGAPASTWARVSDLTLFGSFVIAIILQWYAAEHVCHHALLASGQENIVRINDRFVATGDAGGIGLVTWEVRRRECGWPYFIITTLDPIRASWVIDGEGSSGRMDVIPAGHPIGSLLETIVPRQEGEEVAGAALSTGRSSIYWTSLVFGTSLSWLGLFLAIRSIMVIGRVGFILHGRYTGTKRARRALHGRCPACGYSLEGLDFAASCPECGALLW